jgi:two-component system, NarL family, invasion response regulator UvrY
MKALIVDDHPIMRLGVRQLILGAWPDAEVEEAASLEEGCRKVDALGPEIIILDLGLPDASGTEGVARMLRVAKETPILVLSFNVESAYAARLLKMGVSGYLPKDRAGDELVTAIERIREGKRYVTAATADLLVEMLGGGKAASAAPHELLSTQEHRVMVLIAAGKTPAQMAEIMHLSVKTIGTYRARILEKTSWKNNVELTKYCVQHGLTDSY